METTEPVSSEDEDPSATGWRLSEPVDWVAGAVIAVAGIALAVGGSVLTSAIDREMLADGIESGQITVVFVNRELTQAEAVELAQEILSWTGIGLLVTGVALFLFAVGYVIARHRTYQRTAPGESAGTYRAHAVVGAVVTTVLSFLPFAQLLGSGVAGYMEHWESGRSTSVGALSGFLSVAPAIPILVFVTVGLLSGFAAVQESGLSIPVGTAMFLVVLLISAFGAGIGAIGGFAGGWIAEE